jgi:hypothetical protein
LIIAALDFDIACFGHGRSLDKQRPHGEDFLAAAAASLMICWSAHCARGSGTNPDTSASPINSCLLIAASLRARVPSLEP